MIWNFYRLLQALLKVPHDCDCKRLTKFWLYEEESTRVKISRVRIISNTNRGKTNCLLFKYELEFWFNLPRDFEVLHLEPAGPLCISAKWTVATCTAVHSGSHISTDMQWCCKYGLQKGALNFLFPRSCCSSFATLSVVTENTQPSAGEVLLVFPAERTARGVYVCVRNYTKCIVLQQCGVSGFGGLEVACSPLVPKFAGSHPAKKILSTPSFGGEVKPSVPCRSFTACKWSINVTCKSAFRQNFRTFLAHSSTFSRWVLSRGDTRGDAWWRKLEGLTQIAQ